MSEKHKNSISEQKRKRQMINRFVILFIVFAMVVIWIFAILSQNDVLKAGTPRIITLICLIAVSVIYWIVFYILLRRQNQKEKNK